MRRFRRLFRWFLILLAVLIAGGLITYFILDKPLPQGRSGPEAEALNEKMLAAVNIQAWDSLRYLRWNSSRSKRDYVWDREQDFVEVKYENHHVLLHPRSGKGIVNENGAELKGEAGSKQLAKAIHTFWNDSFWLVAFTKTKDPGTVRQVVDMDDNQKGLLVTYQSGGTTPGDSYLWILDAQGRPTSWRMWAQSLPIGGLEFTWTSWQQLKGGAMVSTEHAGKIVTVKQTGVQGGQILADIGLAQDPFGPLTALVQQP